MSNDITVQEAKEGLESIGMWMDMGNCQGLTSALHWTRGRRSVSISKLTGRVGVRAIVAFMVPQDQLNKWMAGETVPGAKFALNDSVRILSGPGNCRRLRSSVMFARRTTRSRSA